MVYKLMNIQKLSFLILFLIIPWGVTSYEYIIQNGEELTLALAIVEPGDIIILDQTINHTVPMLRHFTFDKSGTAEAPIKFLGNLNFHFYIDGPEGPSGQGPVQVSGDYWEISNLHLNRGDMGLSVTGNHNKFIGIQLHWQYYYSLVVRGGNFNNFTSIQVSNSFWGVSVNGYGNSFKGGYMDCLDYDLTLSGSSNIIEQIDFRNPNSRAISYNSREMEYSRDNIFRSNTLNNRNGLEAPIYIGLNSGGLFENNYFSRRSPNAENLSFIEYHGSEMIFRNNFISAQYTKNIFDLKPECGSVIFEGNQMSFVDKNQDGRQVCIFGDRENHFDLVEIDENNSCVNGDLTNIDYDSTVEPTDAPENDLIYN